MKEDIETYDKQRFPLKTKIQFKKKFWNFVSKYKLYSQSLSQLQQQQQSQQHSQQNRQKSMTKDESVLIMDPKLMPIYR